MPARLPLLDHSFETVTRRETARREHATGNAARAWHTRIALRTCWTCWSRWPFRSLGSFRPFRSRLALRSRRADSAVRAVVPRARSSDCK